MSAVINLNSQLVYAPDFIEIIVPIECDNNSSQIPMPKCLFYCKTKRIFMILSVPTVQSVSKKATLNIYECSLL